MRYRNMSTAPKNGKMILLRIQVFHDSSKWAKVPGCWMAPGGDKQLLGWWSAGATTGSDSYNGLPHRYDATIVTPESWRYL